MIPPSIISKKKDFTRNNTASMMDLEAVKLANANVPTLEPIPVDKIESWDRSVLIVNAMKKKFSSIKDARQAMTLSTSALAQLRTNRKKHYPSNNEINSKVSLHYGDIVTLKVDAIVNAANTTLMGGGGVDYIIHREAGPELDDECVIIGSCPIGDAKITKGYNLPAKYIIHAVGPVGEHPDLLESAYLKSLQLMMENNLKTLAFVCISTGKFGYPIVPATHVALDTVRKWLNDNYKSVSRIIFCVRTGDLQEVYEELMLDYFPS